MSTARDLIEHFKLNVEFSPEFTKHTFYKSDRARGQRKQKVEEIWRRQKQLGLGASGVVWLETEVQSKSERAVKEIRKTGSSSSRVEYYEKELLAMAKLSRHQEVFVHFYGWFENVEKIFLAMEYFPQGDLTKFITDKLREEDAVAITAQLLEGLAIMHESGFTHRDLKPQNIFVVSKSPNWWVKIGDFGLTKRIERDLTALRTYAGTQHFQAPEILGYVDEESSEYTNAVDMWSLGCVTYELLTQTVPFAEVKELSFYCRGKVPFPDKSLASRNISSGAKEFIQGLMAPEPSKRFTVEIAAQHAWLEIAASSPQQDGERAESVRLLLVAGLDVDVQSFEPGVALFQAATVGNIDAVTILLDRYESVINYESEPGFTPLKAALLGGYEKIVKLLLDRNAVTTGYELHWAVAEGHEQMVRMLFYHDRFTASAEDDLGKTPLMWAAEKGRDKIAKLLLYQDDVAVDRTDDSGMTSLMWAARCGHDEVAAVLLSRTDVNPDLRDNSGKTALSYAASGGHWLIVELLLQRDVDINSEDQSGRTPLFHAVVEGHSVVVKHFLNRNTVAPDYKDRLGMTPLAWAASKGFEIIVQLLLEQVEVDPDSRDLSGMTPLLHAEAGGHVGIIQMLKAGIEQKRLISQSDFDPKMWYRLTNRRHGLGRALDIVNDGDPPFGHVQIAATGNYSGQHWQIVPRGDGKFKLRTMYTGTENCLDVWHNDKTRLRVARRSPSSGQYWTIAPWGDGTYKLSNNYSGSGLVLDSDVDGKRPYMGSGHNAGQHWRIDSIAPIDDRRFLQ